MIMNNSQTRDELQANICILERDFGKHDSTCVPCNAKKSKREKDLVDESITERNCQKKVL